jgi:DNA-binding NtrC family response regulator
MASLNDPFFRLLCVDDNIELLQALRRGFGAYGFEVVTAVHGFDALMKFHAHDGNFGAILTDTVMPQMNGIALVKYLRVLGYRGQILVMSGGLTISDGQAYQDYAVSGFLSKPFEIGMVATMLMQDS